MTTLAYADSICRIDGKWLGPGQGDEDALGTPWLNSSQEKRQQHKDQDVDENSQTSH